jgi:hypothetical protein
METPTNQLFTYVPGTARTYWLTRFVILRLLGAIYAIAFLVAINQINWFGWIASS